MSKSSTSQNSLGIFALALRVILAFRSSTRESSGGRNAISTRSRRFKSSLIENGFVSHPQVSVFVKEQNSQPVTVLGAVLHPMTFKYFVRRALLELLANAGGISDTAGTVILITRQTQTETVKPVSDTSNSQLRFWSCKRSGFSCKTYSIPETPHLISLYTEETL